MKIVDTYFCRIYVGFREGYSNKIHSIDEVKLLCQNYCNEKKLCVNIVETEYVYVDGSEAGCMIELINYPRFPSSENEILSKSMDLANDFLLHFNQLRISIVTPNKTYMLEKDG